MDNKEYMLGIYEKAMPNELSLEEKIRLAKESNFDFMEISIDETDEKLARLDYSDEEIFNLLKTMFEEDLFIRTMCLSGHRKYPLGSHDEKTRRKSLEIMEKAIDLAYKMGIRIIQLAGYDVYYEDSDEETRDYFLENLAKATAMAAKKGIILAFETMETEFMNLISKADYYVRKINSPYLKIYPDIGNLKNGCLSHGLDLKEELNSSRGNIVAAHLKETLPGVFRNMDFGTGHTDYDLSIRELSKQGVRIFVGEFWYQGELDYKDKLLKSNEFLRSKLDSNLN